MTPEAKRIAIAEACGWRPGPHGYDSVCPWGVPPKPRHASRHWEELPDYLSDLNATHEAERVLTSRQRCLFEIILLNVVGRPEPFQYNRGDLIALITATAAQRADALLLTLGKLVEEPAKK